MLLSKREGKTLKSKDANVKRVAENTLLGSEIHYHVTYDGQEVILIIPTLGHTTVGMGAEIGFTFTGAVAHIFDKETGKNLEF